MTERDIECFERVRPRLFGIARRVLGNADDADDVVQDAWLRWHRIDRGDVRDPVGFLVTMTVRLALTAGRSARVRHEIAAGSLAGEAAGRGADPWLDAERLEALELALRTLLERLTPAERSAYVLREAFEYPHSVIAQVLGLSEENARQLFVRARRRLAGEPRRRPASGELRRLRDAFVAAARSGELAGLEQVLLDGGAVRRTAPAAAALRAGERATSPRPAPRARGGRGDGRARAHAPRDAGARAGSRARAAR
jgi:RNA polymerase sigma-70 factor (ECF subfamily)